MANYANIKATIDSNINANGSELITGPVLNSVLDQMIDSLGAGYQYKGVATTSTNPGTPDQKVFYIASEAGTYTNFNNLVVADGEVAILKYDSSWTKEVTGAATAAQLNQLREYISTIQNPAVTDPYIRNVYLIPSNQSKFDYLKAVSLPLKLSYLGVRESALGGANSIFALRLEFHQSTNYCDFWIESVPDLSDGLIVELDKNGGVGEIASGFKVYVEFNPSVDLTTASGLLSPNAYIRFIDGALQIPLMYSLSNAIEKIPEIEGTIERQVDKVTYQTPSDIYDFIKTAKVDYRALFPLLKFTNNLFDKDDCIDGYYADGGAYVPVSGYCATRFPIPLKGGATYSYNTAGVTHIDILGSDDFHFVKHIVFNATGWDIVYDESLQIVQFTVPDDLGFDVCARFSVPETYKSSLKICEGTDPSKVSNCFTAKFGGEKNECIIVAKDGTGDYTTIKEACDAAPDGSTICVMPGIYDGEIVKSPESKTLYIIGVDRNACIIRNNAGDYSNPAFHFTSGALRNLTIVNEQQNTSSGTLYPYCIHMDMDNMENKNIDIDNCILINNAIHDGGCVGIGFRGGCTVTIKNSRLIAPNGARVIYCHDNNNEPSGGHSWDGLQQLKVINCVIQSSSFNNIDAIVIQGQGTVRRDFSVSQFYIEFIQNRIKGNAYFTNWYSGEELGEVTEDDFQGVKNLRLSDLSWGNSLSVLNNAE